MDQTGNGISTMDTVGPFLRKGCAPALYHVLAQAYGDPQRGEEQATEPLMGGIMQHGYQCGMLWGATLAAGAQAHRLFGATPQAETRAILAAQRLVESFRAESGETNCHELTGLDDSSTTMQLVSHFLLKGGAVRCCRLAARYAPVALGEVNAALTGGEAEAPSGPVSCAAVLARKMGGSERQAVMVAGLAGGIGLSGGACGALGAAIWMTGLHSLQEGEKVAYKSPRALRVLDRFLECTDYEFECSKIVGRKFESVGDHASHACCGGCSKIIEVLAEEE